MKRFLEICRNSIVSPIVVVDIGAAGGVNEIQKLADLCEIHAVEPRNDSFKELEKLNDKSSYSKTISYSQGLAKTPGVHTLYVTKIPEASSFYRPNTSIVNRWRVDGALDVVSESQIDCITMEQMFRQAGIEHVDLIKLDTQGSELDILLGAKDYLEKISIIKCEVEFVELYKGQPLFDDLVHELSQHGFRFVDFFDGGFAGLGQDKRKRKRIWGDVLFINTKFKTSDSLTKATAILLEMGYFEEARWFVLDHRANMEIFQNMVEALVFDDYPNAKFFQRIHHILQNAGRKSLLLEKFRKVLVKCM